MKKIILNESQLKKIISEQSTGENQNAVNKSMKTFEGERVSPLSLDTIPKLIATPLITGSPTISDFKGMVTRIIKATRVIGTYEKDVATELLLCKNMHDIKGLFKAYEGRMGENLMELLRGEFSSGSDTKKYLYEPIKKCYDASWDAGHFQEEVLDEALFLKLFPCITETPGYEFQQIKDGFFYFFGDDNGTDKMYALKKDGTLSVRKGGKFVSFKNKTKCNASVNESKLLNEQGLELNPDNNTSTDTKAAPEATTGDTKKVDTPEKPKVVTKLMTGNDVKEIQTILHKQGFGDIVGTIDGKLGPNTLAGIKKLFLGVTRPKIEAITSLEPKGIKPIKTKIETPELQGIAEGIQKNFKRFL